VTEPVAAAAAAGASVRMRAWPGVAIAALLLAVYGGLAVSVDFPRAAMGIQSDEATYYMMGYSVALDRDLTYRAEDLRRVWREFPTGPAGVFLKKGRRVTGVSLSARPPFVVIESVPDGDGTRYYYGKSFIYAVCAAPFVRMFGTNGFLVLHALLLALTTLCGYLFLHARMPPAPAALLASAFVLVSVVPVYFVWITPELFNFSLGLLAYFCWLYKEVALPEASPRGTAWLFSARSDVAAAAILGVATFSKPSNALLYVPIFVWHLWRRRWGRAMTSAGVFVVAAAGLFAINLAISGDWNYQGGERNTYYAEYPLQTPQSANHLGVPKARDEALAQVLFERSVFFSNFLNNLRYFFVGRFAGLIPYYFPAVFALAAFVSSPRRPVWQYFVLAAGLAQILLFVISVPYTWNGGGGSVGNRYFMGAYGAFLFLIPPIRSTWAAAMPWVASVFTAPLVLNPFMTSFHPGEFTFRGPFRLLPAELTLVNDWPINTDSSRAHIWFGDNPGQGDPGFLVYFLDRNAYDRESDKSFWVKGESRAEVAIKTDRPMRRAVFTLTAGPIPTDATIAISGRSQRIHLEAGVSQQVTFALDAGTPYHKETHALVWVASVSSSAGFTPIFYDGSTDTRYLGVRVKPILVP
jgi:hypothetical protein